MWCPAPLSEGEQYRRNLRSDKYKPPAGRLLEAYESDSSVEADEDTDVEAGSDLDTGGVVKSQHRTRSMVGKKSASAVAAAIFAVKAAKQKKKKKKKRKRKRKSTSPRRSLLHQFRHPARGRSNRKRRRRNQRRRRMRRSRSCRSLRNDQQGGRKVKLPRGSGS
jgi:hypothetical protein